MYKQIFSHHHTLYPVLSPAVDQFVDHTSEGARVSICRMRSHESTHQLDGRILSGRDAIHSQKG
jgi:hypothetical protein